MNGVSTKWIAENEAETEEIARKLAPMFPPGTVLALIGTLGAGKTRFVRALADVFGHPPETVSSPTYTLLHPYEDGERPIYHFDAYRLENGYQFMQLGPDEYFEAGGITVIEWADKIEEVLPPNHIEIRIEVLGETKRHFEVRYPDGWAPSQ